jgi:hypothetical protein
MSLKKLLGEIRSGATGQLELFHPKHLFLISALGELVSSGVHSSGSIFHLLK